MCDTRPSAPLVVGAVIGVKSEATYSADEPGAWDRWGEAATTWVVWSAEEECCIGAASHGVLLV